MRYDTDVLVVGAGPAGTPQTARALAITHTCMYDAWAAYERHADGTRFGDALRRPPAERTLANKTNPPLVLPQDMKTMDDWLSAMATMRNDLQPPAQQLQPVISDVCRALTEAGAILVRMSGSGATCFGIFDNDEHAAATARTLLASQPGWYVLACNTTGRDR